MTWWLAVWMVLAGPAATSLAAGQQPQRDDAAAGRLPPLIEAIVTKPWTGDFDGMVARRRIRILAPYSRTHFFVDKGQPRGLVQDVAVALEDDINRQLKTTRVSHVFVSVHPTSRDDLYRALVDGRGDVIAAGLTITSERQRLVDFAVPARRNVREILVTGPGAALVRTVDDLSGKLIHVREGSIQLQSLQAANRALAGRGRAPIVVRTVPANLEDEDILEMVNAGIVKATIVDDYMAEFWSQVLPQLQLHRDVAVREAGDLAWAVRKGSAKLLDVLNRFAGAHPAASAFRNVLWRKYLQSTKVLRDSTSPAELAKFEALQAIFQRYGEKYDLDYLLMMAQGYQESRLDQSVRSRVGAIGVMQVMPVTGQELKVGDIQQVEANVHAGVKYIRFTMDTFFANEPISPLDKTLFAFAAYNCGPGRLKQLRVEASREDLNPNVWFDNVERVASARIGRETVQYVSNIYKYYIGYQLALRELEDRRASKTRVSGG